MDGDNKGNTNCKNKQTNKQKTERKKERKRETCEINNAWDGKRAYEHSRGSE